MPDPLGPTSPTEVPASISREISCRIPTGPALDFSVSETSVNDNADVDMGGRLHAGLPIEYGAIRGLRNLVLVFALSGSSVAADNITIAALGDSLTAGYGLPAQDGFVPQMQAWLDSQGADVTLINAGVSGDTTAGGLARVEWTLTPEVDAMIVALGGNDYLRGLDPALSKANLDGILSIAAEKRVDVFLIGILAGANYGSDYQTQFNEMFVDLAEKHDVSLVPTFFQGLLDQAETQDRVLEFMQPDGIHPNRKGVAAIVATLGPQLIEFAQSGMSGE